MEQLLFEQTARGAVLKKYTGHCCARHRPCAGTWKAGRGDCGLRVCKP